MAEKRKYRLRMPNELLYGVCRNIPIAETSPAILLVAVSIWTYLMPIFRKKSVIYQRVAAFIKARISNKHNKRLEIRLDRVEQKQQPSNQSERHHVVIHEGESADQFTLQTNHLLIRVVEHKERSYNAECLIGHGQPTLFGNPHMHFFLRLIAPLVHPLRKELDLTGWQISLRNDLLLRFLSAVIGCIDSVKLPAKGFLSDPIRAALTKCDMLKLHCPGLDLSDLSKLRLALIGWLTEPFSSSGNRKKCCALTRFGFPFSHHELTDLLDELKMQFSGATAKRLPYILRVELFQFGDIRQQLAGFKLHNAVGEQLEFRFVGKKDSYFSYALARCPLEMADSMQLFFFDKVPTLRIGAPQYMV